MVQLDGGIMVGKLIRLNENKPLPEQTVLAGGFILVKKIYSMEPGPSDRPVVGGRM